VCTSLAKLFLNAVHHLLANLEHLLQHLVLDVGCEQSSCNWLQARVLRRQSGNRHRRAGAHIELEVHQSLGETRTARRILEDGGKASVVGAHKAHVQLALGKQQNLHGVVELLPFTERANLKSIDWEWLLSQ